ncbi:vomeronasal 2 receptor 113 [Cricetulus griseus]
MHPRCFWRMKLSEDKDADLVTCYIFFLQLWQGIMDIDFFNKRLDLQKPTKNYRYALAFSFAIDEVNKNPDILPNISLAFGINADGCKTVFEIYKETQSSKYKYDRAPNYVCTQETVCSVMLSGPNWAVSAIIAQAMGLLTSQKVLLLTYGPFHPILSESEQFPYLYQMAPKDTSLALAMVSLILHFNWNWVGLAISDNDEGIQFLSYLRREMEKSILCFAFVNMIPVELHLYISRAEVYYKEIVTSSTNVVIIYGDTDSTLAVSFRMWESQGIQRIWVTTSQWDATTNKKDFTLGLQHGTIAFAHHHAEISGFKTFVQTLNPVKYSNEYLAKLEWMKFNCEASTSMCKTLKNCSSNASLEALMIETVDMAFGDESYGIYNAVYAVAHAFHELLLQTMDNWKVHIFNCSKGLGFKVKIGKFSPYFLHGQQLHLYEDVLEWATGNRQQAMPFYYIPFVFLKLLYYYDNLNIICYDKFMGSGIIWRCGLVGLDVDQCTSCPEEQYANSEQNHCIDKVVIFLNYGDTLGMALVLMATCLSAFTFVILGVFVIHQDTPIVKANNRNLSYTLLISLVVCFLCPLLYIGHPNSASCILQQIVFGVAFTVAVSTVLAKTVTVVLAFKITNPGRRMRYYLVSGAPKYIIASCTIIQTILCAIWLGISPPSINTDAHSEHGHIIIMCDKGSVTAFYIVLGYHGTLALGTFIVAFLARNLPDTFNEAKLLTFSMLLFCTVWVAFLPVYHSTKGKFMVAVEVFSILASSAGLLGCIFIPKCYIILIRPERNSLKKLKEKASS